MTEPGSCMIMRLPIASALDVPTLDLPMGETKPLYYFCAHLGFLSHLAEPNSDCCLDFHYQLKT